MRLLLLFVAVTTTATAKPYSQYTSLRNDVGPALSMNDQQLATNFIAPYGVSQVSSSNNVDMIFPPNLGNDPGNAEAVPDTPARNLSPEHLKCSTQEAVCCSGDDHRNELPWDASLQTVQWSCGHSKALSARFLCTYPLVAKKQHLAVGDVQKLCTNPIQYPDCGSFLLDYFVSGIFFPWERLL